MYSTHTHTQGPRQKLGIPLSSAALLLLVAGCLGSPPGPIIDSGVDAPIDIAIDRSSSSPAIVEIRFTDQEGVSWPPHAVSWKPNIHIELSEAIESEIWLFPVNGVVVRELREDLERTPLRIRHRELALPMQRALVSETEWRLEPVQLVPGDYVLAIPAWAASASGPLRRAWLSRFTVSPIGGATLTHSWPPDEASAVPAALSTLFVRFSGPVLGEMIVRGPAGPLLFDATTVPCRPLGFPDGTCQQFRLHGPLRQGSLYILDPRAVRDVAGRPLAGYHAFHTVADDTPPRPRILGCQLGESTHMADDEGPRGCASVDDTSITLRMRFDGPVRGTAVSEWNQETALAPRGELTLRTSRLPPDTEVRLNVVVYSLTDQEWTHTFYFRTAPSLPSVAISEVRANPAGREPHQEYVELWNLGDTAVDLSGWSLADSPDHPGDLLSGQLSPHARILVVADRFDSNGAEDAAFAPIPAGTPLIRIGSSLGSGGLSNGGEPLFLRDGELRVIDRFPASAAPPEGYCLVSRPLNRHDDDVEAAPCSPGTE